MHLLARLSRVFLSQHGHTVLCCLTSALATQGVFETIRVWAAQGWVLQSVFFCELPLGDHVRVRLPLPASTRGQRLPMPAAA